MNLDGVISIEDATLIQKYIIGKKSDGSVVGDVYTVPATVTVD